MSGELVADVKQSIRFFRRQTYLGLAGSAAGVVAYAMTGDRLLLLAALAWAGLAGLAMRWRHYHGMALPSVRNEAAGREFAERIVDEGDVDVGGIEVEAVEKE